MQVFWSFLFEQKHVKMVGRIGGNSLFGFFKGHDPGSLIIYRIKDNILLPSSKTLDGNGLFQNFFILFFFFFLQMRRYKGF